MRISSLGAASAVIVAALLQITPISDNDLWWLLKTGELMVTTRSFPTTDPFTWTAEGAPWINHTWGFELILYGVFAAAGFGGLIALQVLFALATFAVVYRTVRRAGTPVSWAVAVVGIVALATRGFWTPRPQIVTYLALALLCAVIQDYREGRGDRLGWLPVLMALWVNLHGGFFVGLGVLGLTAGTQAIERLFDAGPDAPPVAPAGRPAAWWGVCVAATLLNPFHVRALAFPLHVAADRVAKDFIIEWSSPAFQNPELRLLESVLLLFLVTPVVARGRPRLGQVALLLAFLHLTLDATRNIPLFLIVLAPAVGRLGADIAETVRAFVGQAGGLARPRAWVIVGLIVLAPVPWFRELAPGVGSTLVPRWGVAPIFPVGAADYLLAHPTPGPLFNDYGWGGYLIWRLFPHYRVFIDGRMAVFSRAVREDFLKVNNGEPGWRDVLERRGVDVVLVRSGTAVSALLRTAPDWGVAYEDGQATIFRRRPDSQS